jgi:hypothetical protein
MRGFRRLVVRHSGTARGVCIDHALTHATSLVGNRVERATSGAAGAAPAGTLHQRLARVAWRVCGQRRGDAPQARGLNNRGVCRRARK